MAARAHNVTDRALRYRANATPPHGPKICALCGSKTNVEVGHANGKEEDNDPGNLFWTCRSCNVLAANTMRNSGLGRKTHQYNPSKGATTLGEWMQAVMAIKGQTTDMPVSEAVSIIRATSPAKRSEFASDIWARRRHRTRYNKGDVIDQAAATGMELYGDMWALPSAVLDQTIKTALGAKDALKRKLLNGKRNPDWHDELDVRRAGDRAAKDLMRSTGVDSKAARSVEKSAIQERYRIAVEYEDMTPGMEKQWIEGWRKGYGVKNNPENGAAHFYKKFHGRDSEEELVIETEIHFHEWLGVLGMLAAVVVDPSPGGRADIEFDEKDAPWLCSNEEGTQLFFEGGNQELDLKKLGFKGHDLTKESIVIGEFSPPEGKRKWSLAYVTEKAFDSWETIRYEHDLGEPDEGEPKHARRVPAYLVYDSVNKLMSIAGGSYHIKLPWVGVSPGIEN